MTTSRRFNWEAALVPCWGWLRRVPIARGLSLLFPFGVIAVLGTERTLFWTDIAAGLAVPSVAYGILYGIAGDWMMRHARSKQAPGTAERELTVGGLLWHVFFSALMLAALFVVVIAAIAPNHRHDQAFRGAMKSDLRNLVTAQEAYFADHSRFAATLDSLLYESSLNVTVSLIHTDSLSWAAEASYRDVAQRCRISIGRWDGAPADSLEGSPICDPELEQH